MGGGANREKARLRGGEKRDPNYVIREIRSDLKLNLHQDFFTIKSFLFFLSLPSLHLTTEKLLIHPFTTHGPFIVPDPSLKNMAVALISNVLKYYGLCHSREPFSVQPSDSYFLNPLYYGRLLLLPTPSQPSLPS